MSDEAAGANVLELAADLTIAWLSNPGTKISADELPAVIQKIHGALANLSSAGAGEAEATLEYTPAVSVRRSLASKDHLISLIDGKPYKMLKRHLAGHGLTPAEYRERYGLKPDYPMVAESYSQTRRALAVKIGLGRKPGEKAPPAKSARAAGRKPAKAKAKVVAKAPAATAPKAST